MSELLFGSWARRHALGRPDALAVADLGADAIPYARLAELVESAAGELAGAGVRRADRVALLLPGGVVAAFAFLAVTAAAIAAPLNPAHSPDDLRFELTDLRIKLLIVEDGYQGPALDQAGALGIPVARIGPDLRVRVPPFAEPVGRTVADRDDVALVLHTSGTTAKPKTVPLTHFNLSASAASISASLRLTPGDLA